MRRVGITRFPLDQGFHLDTQRSGTMTVEMGAHPVVRIRARGAHREYELPLGLAAEMIAARAAKLGLIRVKPKEGA